MVYCRSCGQEISETAPTCPHCNASQIVHTVSPSRNIGVLIGITLVWASAFWIGGLLATGVVVGLLEPEASTEKAKNLGKDLSGIYMLIALGASGTLTIAGQLPGTRKMNKPNNSSSV